jgi:hypothetical protein
LISSDINKIIVKILANKLKMVLEKIFSKPQNTFIRERQILDLELIANKCLDSIIRSVVSGVLCKLDIEKTNHPTNWDFFTVLGFEALEGFGVFEGFFGFCIMG